MYINCLSLCRLVWLRRWMCLPLVLWVRVRREMRSSQRPQLWLTDTTTQSKDTEISCVHSTPCARTRTCNTGACVVTCIYRQKWALVLNLKQDSSDTCKCDEAKGLWKSSTAVNTWPPSWAFWFRVLMVGEWGEWVTSSYLLEYSWLVLGPLSVHVLCFGIVHMWLY